VRALFVRLDGAYLKFPYGHDVFNTRAKPSNTRRHQPRTKGVVMGSSIKNDKTTNVHDLKERMRRFCEERDWDQFHHPKDLLLMLLIESGELAEHFRFKSDKQIKEMLATPEGRTKVGDEIADVMLTLLRFAQIHNIDVASEVERKMCLNETKYPVDKVKGNNKKYDEY
jgi:dCTP diphosphatase